MGGMKRILTFGAKRSVLVIEMSKIDALKAFDHIVSQSAKKWAYKFVGRLDQEDLYQELRLVVLDVFNAYQPERKIPFEALLCRSLFNKQCKLFYKNKLHRADRIQTISYDQSVNNDIALPRLDLLQGESGDFSLKPIADTNTWLPELRVVAELLCLGLTPSDIQNAIRERFQLACMPINIEKYELVRNVDTKQIFSLKKSTKVHHFRVLNNHLIIKNIGVDITLDRLQPVTAWARVVDLGCEDKIEMLGDNPHYGKIAARVLGVLNGHISYSSLRKFFHKKVRMQQNQEILSKVVFPQKMNYIPVQFERDEGEVYLVLEPIQ